MSIDVLQLTDTHLRGGVPAAQPPVEFSDAVELLAGRSTDDLASEVVDAALHRHGRSFDLAVHTGDIADPVGNDGYDAAVALLQRAAPRFLATPGNHDDPSGFERVAGDQPATVSCDLGAWRIVLISSAQPPQSAGWYHPDALDALAVALDCGRPAMIGTHHPPLSPCSDPECCTSNAWMLLDIIDQHPNARVVISGHLHLDDAIFRRGVSHYVSPSTALQLRHRHPLPANNHEATDVGARVIRLHDDGTHETHIAWLGRGVVGG